MNKLLIALIFVFLSSKLFAESCSYTDCENQIGYVYLPKEVLWGYQSLEEINLNGKAKYTLVEKENFPFQEIGLPEVNSIVTSANNYTSFYWHETIPKIIDSLKKHKTIEYDQANMKAIVQPFYEPAFQMSKGNKLKVLGFQYFNFKGIEDKLFVMVQYVSDK